MVHIVTLPLYVPLLCNIVGKIVSRHFHSSIKYMHSQRRAYSTADQQQNQETERALRFIFYRIVQLYTLNKTERVVSRREIVLSIPSFCQNVQIVKYIINIALFYLQQSQQSTLRPRHIYQTTSRSKSRILSDPQHTGVTNDSVTESSCQLAQFAKTHQTFTRLALCDTGISTLTVFYFSLLKIILCIMLWFSIQSPFCFF